MSTSTVSTTDLPTTTQEVFELLPVTARRAVYAAYALVGLILSSVSVGLAAAGSGWPLWLTVTSAVYPVVGAGVGIVAASNTQKAMTSVTASTAITASAPATEAVTTPAITTDTTDATDATDATDDDEPVGLEEPPADTSTTDTTTTTDTSTTSIMGASAEA